MGKIPQKCIIFFKNLEKTYLQFRIRLCFSLALNSLDEFSSRLSKDSSLSNHLTRIITSNELTASHQNLLHDVRDLVSMAILNMIKEVIESPKNKNYWGYFNFFSKFVKFLKIFKILKKRFCTKNPNFANRKSKICSKTDIFDTF